MSSDLILGYLVRTTLQRNSKCILQQWVQMVQMVPDEGNEFIWIARVL